MTIADLFVQAKKLAADNSPAILTAVAAAGVVTTAVLTAKATLKADKLIKREQARIDEAEKSYPLSNKEKVQVAWKAYIPPAAACAATLACIVAANQIGTRRAASVAAAYSVLERGFSEYKDKVVERLGEKKEHELRDEIAQDRVNANPPSNTQVIITGAGDHLCYDMASGRYFLSNMEALKKAQNDLNHQVLSEGYASLTDFYHKIGLRPTDGSDEVGWTADNELLELDFPVVLSEDQRPCLAFSFNVKPYRGYYHGHR